MINSNYDAQQKVTTPRHFPSPLSLTRSITMAWNSLLQILQATKQCRIGLCHAVLWLFMVIGLSHAPLAVEPDEILADPFLESRARAISQTLRCMVCQGQSIDDSNASFARDLRLLIRERLGLGESNDQITAYLVTRYGTYILMHPPIQRNTMLLWFAPIVLLGIGGILILTYFASYRPRVTRSDSLSLEEQHSLTALCDSEISSSETPKRKRSPVLRKNL